MYIKNQLLQYYSNYYFRNIFSLIFFIFKTNMFTTFIIKCVYKTYVLIIYFIFMKYEFLAQNGFLSTVLFFQYKTNDLEN